MQPHVESLICLNNVPIELYNFDEHSNINKNNTQLIVVLLFSCLIP